jgi:hypothetical protein
MNNMTAQVNLAAQVAALTEKLAALEKKNSKN